MLSLRDTSKGKTFIWEAGKKGHPCNPSHFRKMFKMAIASVDGVRALTPHSCRHTFVSMMREMQVDVNILKLFTGHTQLDMVDHYTHVRETECMSAIAKLAAAFPIDKSVDTV